MKIDYVTSYDATNANGYGVRAYYMIQAFKKIVDSINLIGPLPNPEQYLLLSLVLRAKLHFYAKVFKKDYHYSRDSLLLKKYAQQISRKLSSTKADIVLSPVSPASQPVAYLDCKQPIVIWTDATFAGAIDFYPGLDSSRLCQETLRDGLANERAALNRCSLVIYSSEWAAQAALEHYQIHPSKVRVVPFGANINCDRELNDIKTILETRSSHTCKLLFVGEDWHRKGGDIAIRIAEKLNRSGLNTELTIVGCNSSSIDEPLPSFVKFWGYISKSTQEGADKLDKLFSESHFLILPTRADCTPNSIPEANSFGIPCITTNVGGIPTMVSNNLNGQVFSKNASINEYCSYILDLFSDNNNYKRLAMSAFNEYQTRFNWEINTQTVKKLMMELIA